MIIKYFNDTLSGNSNLISVATAWLGKAEQQPGFSVSLLKMLASGQLSPELSIAISTYFKNFIMKHWVTDEGETDLIPEADRGLIKTHITNLMLTSPKKVQAQLSQALSIISQADFPAQWPNLLPELVQKMETGNYDVILGVLETMNSITYRYRVEMASNTLWAEVKYVLETSQAQLTALFKKVCAALPANTANAAVMPQLGQILVLLTRLFYSLSVQDIPAYFEDHLKDWFAPFQQFLKFTNDFLNPAPRSDAPGIIDDLKAAICDVVSLYTEKYEEQFDKFVPGFVNEIWQLLTQLSDASRYDQLVTTAIKFLTSVVKRENYSKLFESQQALQIICEKVVIPQIKLRESDIELFSMDGIEYVRRDMEGSDVDTRRRTTVDFVKGLCKYFEERITNLLKGYIAQLLQEYNTDRANKWIMKDAAMYIVLALSIQSSTESKGATRVNQYINIMDFFGSEVLPELNSPKIDERPVLKADCLKFICTFRGQLEPNAYPTLMPLLQRYLASEEFVIHTYAAVTIERLMSVKDSNNQRRFTKQALQPYIRDLLTGLFSVLNQEESRENDYVMKAIMRVCSVAQETIAPFVEVLLKQISTILFTVAQNPRNAHFNHFLFETLAALISHICKSKPEAVAAFEGALFPVFQKMLGLESGSEFGPYVFQIMALMLNFRTEVSPVFAGLYKTIVQGVLYENVGNIPALVSLLSVYMKKGWLANPSNPLEPVLGVFQKLLSSNKQDVHGLTLLEYVVEYVPLERLKPMLFEMMKLLFSKQMSPKKTVRFTNGLITFIAHFVSKHGFATLLEPVEQLQKGLFVMFFEKVILPQLSLIIGEMPRKTVQVGLVNLLCRSPAFVAEPYAALWPKAMAALITMMEQASVATVANEDDDDVALNRSFSTAFSALAFALPTDFDPHPSIASTKDYLAQSLPSLPPQIKAMIGQLPPQQQAQLQSYCQKAQVAL